MKNRRRRWLREEALAPWITVAVILTLWWGATWLVRPEAPSSAVGGAQEDATPMPAREADTRRLESQGLSTDAAPALRRGETGTMPSPMSETVSSMGTAGRTHIVPVSGIDPSDLTSSFHEARGGGSRRHEAMDIMAARGTPVVASTDGRIVKLFTSAAGGLTIYQFDADETHCYYYAHLDAYAPDLTEGQEVFQGQVIGFVGTTGNAAPDAPHLHFAIHRLGPERRWWEGEPIDPLPFLR